MPFPPSELILNPRGSIYHLDLRPEEVAALIIVVGDPDRVPQVSQYFDDIEYKVQKREFCTHTGRIAKQRLSVISSGIGTDNVEILMTELDALHNIDFQTRELKEQIQELKIIRLGTSGSLQKDLAPDTILLSSAALGLDTLMQYYQWPRENLAAQSLIQKTQQALQLDFSPYFAQASASLLSKFSSLSYARGITLTAPGFYAPQGRELRLKAKVSGALTQIARLEYQGERITNLEMETAGYYALAHLLGHQMLSVNAILANRMEGTFSSQPQKIVEKMIEEVLRSIDRGI